MKATTVRVSFEADPGVMVRSSQHLQNLLAEMRVIASGVKTDTLEQPVPSELAQLISGILAQYSGVYDETQRRARQAWEAGEKSVVIEIDLPPVAADAARDLLVAIERADEYCRQGILLTLPADDEVAAYRRNYVEEVIRQLERR